MVEKVTRSIDTMSDQAQKLTTNPEIPVGDTASGADMLKAKKAVETFVFLAPGY